MIEPGDLAPGCSSGHCLCQSRKENRAGGTSLTTKMLPGSFGCMTLGSVWDGEAAAC